MNPTEQAIEFLECWLWQRYGIALIGDERVRFYMTITHVLRETIEEEVYQALRRRLEYRQLFTMN